MVGPKDFTDHKSSITCTLKMILPAQKSNPDINNAEREQ